MTLGVELTGLAAASLTTASFLPQVVRAWRTRDTRAISLPMYLMFTLGVVLWLAYGLAIQSPAVIVANAVTTALSAVILALKLRYG